MIPALALGMLAGWGLFRLGWLTPGGGAAAALLGALAWVKGGLWAPLWLLAFVTAGNLLGRPVRRTAAQVLANGLAPVLGLWLGPGAFLGGLAAAAADTLAGEIGARAPYAWRPDRGRVAPGTNAAVSLQGSLALVLAALTTSAAAPLLGARPGPVFAGGVAGAMVDTVAGLVLEERLRFWNNELTNLACTLTGTLIGALG